MAILNLAARFVVELLGLVFVAAWGLAVTEGPARYLFAALAVAAFVLVWARFLAPNSNSGLSRTQKNVLGTLVLLVAAAALAVAGNPSLALAYAAIVVVNAALLLAFPDAAERAQGRLGPRA